MSLYETIQLVAALVIAAVFGLSVAARRNPQVGWLQGFSGAFHRRPEEQRRKERKRTDFRAGVELILIGIALPIGHAIVTTILFSEFATTATVLVAAASLVCIGLGVMAILRSRG